MKSLNVIRKQLRAWCRYQPLFLTLEKCLSFSYLSRNSKTEKCFCIFYGQYTFLPGKAYCFTVSRVKLQRVIPGISMSRRATSNSFQNSWSKVYYYETTDSTTKEQCMLALRWVDDALEPHEEFIGMHDLAVTDATSIVGII